MGLSYREVAPWNCLDVDLQGRQFRVHTARYETFQRVVIDGVPVRHGGGFWGISSARVAVT